MGDFQLFDLNTIQHIWFTAFVILVTGYVILDGFDLGTGIIHLFIKKDEERRLALNSIGPVWDGNEVWLVTAGGALFAGFPAIYATICSAFYLPIMLLLAGIIFRGVAIEFRSKQSALWWRTLWDTLFSCASLVIAFMLGTVAGALIQGIPLDAEGEFIGTFTDFIHPYSLLLGLFAIALFAMHGLLFLLMKTEGSFHDHLRKLAHPAMIQFILLYALTTTATLIYQSHMAQAFKERPYFFLIAGLHILTIANIPRLIHQGRDGLAFIFSSLNIIFLMVLFAIGTYPIVVRATNDPAALSLTIFNSSSTSETLHILLLIAGIGIPLVLAYTISIYYIFRGKVKLDSHSY